MSGPPDPNLDEARRWMAHASEDWATAKELSRDRDAPPRIACFLAHLAAEKAIKAWLISLDTPFRKVHDLAELRAMLPAAAADQLGTPGSSGSQPMVDPGPLSGRCQRSDQ